MSADISVGQLCAKQGEQPIWLHFRRHHVRLQTVSESEWMTTLCLGWGGDNLYRLFIMESDTEYWANERYKTTDANRISYYVKTVA